MRRVGKVAFWAAGGGVVLPMAGGIVTAVLFGLPLYWEAIFIVRSDGHQRQHFRPDADGAWRAALARRRDHPAPP